RRRGGRLYRARRQPCRSERSREATAVRHDRRLALNVSGSTFLVTGGGSGLGAATASLLEDAGANVVVADLGRREEIGRFVETDVRDEASVQAAIDAAVDLGPLRGAVNCAGIGAACRVVGKDGEP